MPDLPAPAEVPENPSPPEDAASYGIGRSVKTNSMGGAFLQPLHLSRVRKRLSIFRAPVRIDSCAPWLELFSLAAGERVPHS
jgi:hypothetical protein